jgi:alpha-tubulin suppressor-like RCC1 family protein
MITVITSPGGRLMIWGEVTYYSGGSLTTSTRTIPTEPFNPYTDWSWVDYNSNTQFNYTAFLGIRSNNRLYQITATGDAPLYAGKFIAGNLSGPGFGNKAITNITTTNTENDNWVKCWIVGNNYFALNSDNELWGWGLNSGGELGLGNTTTYTSGNMQLIAQNVSEFVGYGESGAHHFLYKTTSGQLYGWGYNNVGQLGKGSVVTYYATPTQIVASGVLDIAAGQSCSFYINASGRRYVTGSGTGYKLGNSDTATKYTFTLAPETTVYKKVYSRFAIDSTDKLWAWGGNAYGQLGTGNTTTQEEPIQIGTDTNWLGVFESVIPVSTAQDFAIVQKINGTIWSAGRNNKGQLGLGDTTDRSTFTNITLKTYQGGSVPDPTGNSNRYEFIDSTNPSGSIGILGKVLPTLSYSQSASTISSSTSLSITDSSSNATSISINWGDGSSQTVSPGSTTSHSYVASVTSDSILTITVRATNENGYQEDTSTVTIYVPQSPTFTIETNPTTSIVATSPGVQFNNISANTLGHTAIFGSGNKWRWTWGDGTTTDVNVGDGSAGDRNIPIFHTYTITPAEILAGLPVTKTITLKAYNGHSSSPFTSASQTLTILPLNPNFPNRINQTLDDANIPDIIKVKTTQVWGVRGGGNT